MLERLANCLLHPSQIARLFRDKVHHIIITFLLVFLPFVLVLGIICYNTDYVDYDNVYEVSNVLAHSKNEINVVYSGGKITGDEYVISADSTYYFIFNSEKVSASGYSFLFKEDKVSLYMSGILINETSYDELSKYDFVLSKAQAGDLKNKNAFEDFLYSAIVIANPIVQGTYFAKSIVNVLGMYLALLVIAFIMGMFTNKDLGLDVRIKLTIYSTLVFFAIAFIALFCGDIGQYVMYAGAGIALIYNTITLRHIVRTKKRED